MKHHLLFIISYSLFIVLFSGCSGKPSDVPQLYPCAITVKNGSAPIADADVILGSSAAGSIWASSGKTDSNGNAVIRTTRLKWTGKGLPAGEYTVTLMKPPKIEMFSMEEIQKMEPLEQEKYNAEQAKKFDNAPREIPVELSEADKSPFKITVSKGQENKAEIDISTFKPKK